MQYKISALHDAVQRALAVDRAQQEQNYQTKLGNYETALAEWIERHNARWANASKVIAAACRKNQPIVPDMIPGVKSGYSRAPDTFDVKHPGEFEYKPSVELTTVANALPLIPGETVSPRDLAAMGVNGHVLRYVLGLAPVRDGKSTAVTE
jgi:hypothetical protein